MSGLRRATIQVIASLALIYAAVCAAVYFLQERLIFLPEKLPDDFRFAFPGHYAEHRIAVVGAQLSALWFRAEAAGDSTRSAKGTVFYLHGNAGSLASWGDVAPTFTARGYDVFILDYRGYGKSSGAISSEAQLHADVEHAYQYLLGLQPSRPLYIYGRSVGAGLAAELARKREPQALLLEAPFISLADMARRHYPWLPRALLRYPLRTDAVLREVRAPVYFFHGDADDIIPAQSSEQLAALVSGEKHVFTIAGGGHNDLPDSKAYNTALDRVLP